MSPKKPQNPGTNLSGTGTAPARSKEMIQGAQQGGPDPASGDFRQGLAAVHLEYVRGADPLGKVPPPTTLKGAAKTFIDMMQARKTPVLLDKVGERIAFERTGVRLYDLVLVKHELHGSWKGGPEASELMEHRQEELDHLHLLVDAMKQLGGDPTAVTPSADVVAVESMGLQKVVADARTTLDQALHALLVAELTDNDGWDMLIDLAEGFGHAQLASRFRDAKRREEEHLQDVRRWLAAHAKAEAGTA